MDTAFTGVGVALVTPFKKDYTVDYEQLEKVIQHISDGGVDYIVANGTTGEASTLSNSEKKEVLQFIADHNPKKLPILYGIGANNTQYVLDNIDDTNTSLIDGILTVCPYYNKPTQEGIYQHYKAVANHTSLPVILYNVPGRSAVNISAETTIRLAEIPNIIGTKEASGDLVQAMKIEKSTADDFLLISGDDILTVPMASFGVKGVISVLANAIPSKFCQMVHASLKQDFDTAQNILLEIVDLNELMYEENNPVGIKQLMHQLRLCDTTVRLPLVKASEELAQQIATEVNKLGL